MSESVTNELVFEILKQIQARLERVDHALKDIHGTQISVREDIHRVDGGQLRLERLIAEGHLRLDRIEKRLGLVDA